MPQSAPSKTSAWYNTAETVLIAGSIGSSVAAVVLQQVTFAAITSIQLSFVVGLGSWNRKRFDEINQQNQAVITQLQQQFLQGKQSFEQVSQATQQLPTYKEIGDLQHHIERLESDHQKHTNQLHEEVRHQESQLHQLKNELASLYQALQSIPQVDVDLLQDRIHNLKAHFELKLRNLEQQPHQPWLKHIEEQASKTEKNVANLLQLGAEHKSFVSLFANECQNWKRQFQELTERISRFSSLEGFNPEDMRRDVQILLEEIKNLEVQIQKPSELDKEMVPENLKEQITQIQNIISFLDQKTDKLNESYLKSISSLSHDKNQLEKHLKSLEETDSKLIEKISMFEKRIIKIEKIIERITTPPRTCDWCGKASQSMLVGGPFNNSRYCSSECMRSDRRD